MNDILDTLDAAAVARLFRIDGELAGVSAYGSGHINDTFSAVFDARGRTARYILQRINTHIFRNPVALMENVERITLHLAQKQAGEPDGPRRGLSLIPARDGRAWIADDAGGYWRMYRFLEGTRSYDAVESAQQAYEAARAFGRFQQLLADLPAPRLHDTIPDFHNTPERLAAFESALRDDVMNRAVLAKPEIEFALAHAPLAGALLDADFPERVTHNDCKFNNVMLDDVTGEGLCVIDLDTAMPGLALYDFGDMVRTATSPAAEDERDLSKVDLQFPMFEALVRGYLSSAGGFLSKQEKMHLVTAGKVITYEQGIRFLGDYLAGDTYYKVHREGHNLDRTRTQFKLIESMEQQEVQMLGLIDEIAGE